MNKMVFTYDNLKAQFETAINNGYHIITCKEYVKLKNNGLRENTIVNRIDIDFSVKKVEKMVDIFNELNIKGTFFVRLHAPEYNPFSFENYRILKKMVDTGHEIGYHSEIVDQAAIWNENAADCLQRDIAILESMLNIKVVGVASHGGMTGLNNLDFWKQNKPKDFDLRYEGYDYEEEFNLFQEALYVSDSEWTQWKCYNKGKLVEGDRRNLAEHTRDKSHKLIYLLIHPDTYYNMHFYENEK